MKTNMTIDQQIANAFINSLRQYEDKCASKEHNQKYYDELIEMIEQPEATPQINHEAIAVANALAKYDPNAPKITARTFNQTSYDQNDKLAKDLFSTYIKNKGHIIITDEETFGIDVISNKDGKDFKFELELSSIDFNNENYPWENIHFLGRKKKMLDKEGDYWYIIISTNQKFALMAKASDIFKQENYIVKYAGNGRDGNDEFYQLPRKNIRFFSLTIDK